MPKKVYILSGLGADERVFQKIDFPGYSVTYINWIEPKANETIENYASRLLIQITGSNPVIVGLSFGGIMAMEIAKLINTRLVILISSVRTRLEIPFYYRWAGWLGLHYLLPAGLFKRSGIIVNWFFGTGSYFDRRLLKQILIDTDPKFLKWAIDRIVTWDNNKLPDNLIHIHGTSDRIIPLRFVSPDIPVNNGGHLMTLDKSTELSAILQDQLNSVFLEDFSNNKA